MGDAWANKQQQEGEKRQTSTSSEGFGEVPPSAF
jgi:hypothetical protein